MTLQQAATPTFANHQTFHPRFGWIKKGFNAAAAQPNIFSEKSAPVDLGVGKNMVEAIRFWALATKVITRRPHPDRPRTAVYTPTWIGRALLDDRVGFDPYLEDPGTLWMLHWHAVTGPTILPIWRLMFNDFSGIEFTDEDFLQYCVDEIAATTWPQPMKSSVQKDVDCMLRMYSRREIRGRQVLDDLIDSPFRELGLIRPSAGAGRNAFRIIRGHKPTLPATTIAYACVDYLSRGPDGSQTITLTRLAADPGSPGRLLKLTEQDIADAMEEASALVGNLRLARPAGARQLAISAPYSDVAFELLAARCNQRSAPVPALPDSPLVGSAATEPVLSDPDVHRLVRRVERQRAQESGDAA